MAIRLKNWNSAKITTISEKYVRSTRFATISSGTSGTITLPSNATVILDDFGGTTDAVISGISGGKPTGVNAYTSLNEFVATSFDGSGNWSLTGVPTSYPIAIIYRVRQTLYSFDSTSSDIVGDSHVEDGTSLAQASTSVRRDPNANANFGALTMANVSSGVNNVGIGVGASASSGYPLLIQRDLATPIHAQMSNPNTGAGSGVKYQLAADAGNNGAEFGLFAAATAAPDAYAGGNMTIRTTGATAGIAYIADDVSTAYHKFYAGGNGSSALMQKIDAVDGISLYRTITAGGTTGNQTINKIAGTVNIAAAGTTVTVTNSMVDTSSIIHCVLRTNDSTATIKNVVPGSGSFVINLGASATAEVSIGFFVVN